MGVKPSVEAEAKKKEDLDELPEMNNMTTY